MTDGFPHDAVGRPEFLEFRVGGAEFVQDAVVEMEEDGPGGGFPSPPGQKDGPAVLRYNMLLDFFEEFKGLRGQAVLFPGQAVEAVVFRRVPPGIPDADLDAFPAGLPEIPPGRPAEPGEDPLLSGREIENVPEEGFIGPDGAEGVPGCPGFEDFPGSFPSGFHRGIEEGPEGDSREERVAVVREGEGHPPPGGRGPPDVHEREKPDGLSVLANTEICGTVAVGFREDRRPRPAVEEARSGKGQDLLVPGSVGKGVADLRLQVPRIGFGCSGRGKDGNSPRLSIR